MTAYVTPPIPAWAVLAVLAAIAIGLAVTDGCLAEFRRRFALNGGSAAVSVRRMLLFALIFFVLVAIYGSWVPFRTVSVSPAEAARRFFDMLSHPLTFRSRSDWATNVLLFLPIGFFATGLARGCQPKTTRALVALPLVFLGCMLLSFFVECGQLWIARRTCSQNDMVAESLGGLCGVLAWVLVGPRFSTWLERAHATAKPRARLEQLLEIYLFVFVCYALMPLDLALRPAELYHKYKEGKITVAPFGDTSVFTLFGLLANILLLVPIGVLVAIWRRHDDQRPRPLLKSILLGAAVVIGIEAAQLFVYSRYSSTTDILTGLAGVTLGWGIARWCAARFTSTTAKERGISAQRSLSVAAVSYAIVLVAIFCLPFDRLSTPAEVQARWRSFLIRPPLAAFYAGTELNAISEILRKILLFSLLGGLLAAAVQTKRWHITTQRILLVAVWLAGTCLAAGIECLQIYLPPHIADITDVLLGAFGMAIGVAALLWVNPRYEQDSSQLFD